MTSPGRAEWLDLGLEQLGNEGLQGLRIATLCSAAGKTTGSFYHHFQDHGAYVLALVEHWKEHATDRIVATARAQSDRSSLGVLNELALELDPVLELRIRQLAEREPEAVDALAAVDAARLDFLAELYQNEGGARLELARDLALLDYSAFLGFALLRGGADPKAAERLAALMEGLAGAYVAIDPTRTGRGSA